MNDAYAHAMHVQSLSLTTRVLRFLSPMGDRQGFHFWKLKFIGVTDKEDKQDISKISDQIQIKFNLNLSKFK